MSELEPGWLARALSSARIEVDGDVYLLRMLTRLQADPDLAIRPVTSGYVTMTAKVPSLPDDWPRYEERKL